MRSLSLLNATNLSKRKVCLFQLNKAGYQLLYLHNILLYRPSLSGSCKKEQEILTAWVQYLEKKYGKGK